MFNYKVEQKTYNIGKYSIGGDPRSASTAMVGTIFYYKQKNIFIDEPNGIINKEYAEKVIKDQEELADKTGLVPCLDVILSYESSIKPLLDFIADITDVPIFLDPPSYEIKVPTLQYLKELGNLKDRIVYNSITSDSYDEEYALLSKSGLKNFVLLTIESRLWTTQARMDVLKEILNKANNANLAGNNYLIDTCVIDTTSLGLAMSAMNEIKNLYGFPVGSGAHNAVDTWRNLKEKFGDVKKYVNVVSSVITLGAGADFLLYGPVQNADVMYPNVAFVKAAQSQLLFDECKMPPENHPVFKIG